VSTLFFPLVSSSLSAAAELLTLAAQVLAIVVGVRFVADVLDILARILAALRWLAGLLQLLLLLACTVIGDVAPLVGRHLGRAAGTAFRLGRQARRWYNRHAAPTVTTVLASIGHAVRGFVLAQLGTAYPALTAILLPAAPEPAALVLPDALTRRQLLALAREARLPRYSRRSTAELRQLLAA
jgi:hypothetical protein